MDSGLDFWNTAFPEAKHRIEKKKEDKYWLVVRPL